MVKFCLDLQCISHMTFDHHLSSPFFFSQIEILTYCQLTSRQRLLYQALRNKISIEDLLQSSMGTAQQAHSTTSSLMNLVMQFRKVGRSFFRRLYIGELIAISSYKNWLIKYFSINVTFVNSNNTARNGFLTVCV